MPHAAPVRPVRSGGATLWRSVRLFDPLRHRDFARLTLGSTISLLGDGVFSVALAWQVYQLSNVPTALSAVGVAWTLPLVIFLLYGGIMSDRVDRRRVMVAADLVRAAVLVTVGLLSVGGGLRLRHLVALMPFFGIGDAFFGPASTAIVPELVPEADLERANALDGMLRPLMLSLAGPALGGLVVGAFGPGPALLFDAASFLVSAAATAAIAAHPRPRPTERGVAPSLRQVGEGLAFVRANPWCWAALLGGAPTFFVFGGPLQVLLPYLVKNDLNAGAEGLGLIFAVGGIGAILISLLLGQIGLPRRPVTAMFCTWSVGVLCTAGYGLMADLWQGMVVALVVGAFHAASGMIWSTLLQRLVPRALLGGVSSVDWLVATVLAPVSLALTGPAAAAVGARAVLVIAPLVAAVTSMAFLFVPGVRDPERHAAVAGSPWQPARVACSNSSDRLSWGVRRPAGGSFRRQRVASARRRASPQRRAADDHSSREADGRRDGGAGVPPVSRRGRPAFRLLRAVAAARPRP